MTKIPPFLPFGATVAVADMNGSVYLWQKG